MNDQYRKKLLEMRAADLRVREELAKTGALFEGYCPAMEAVHLENAAALDEMLAAHGGWLGKSAVGADGADAAWLIAMHAISLPEFLRRCLKLLESAAANGEAEPAQAATMRDRVNFFEGEPQRYGTQSDWNADGKMAVWMLENADRVNEWRRAVGLERLAAMIWENAETRENAPPDYAERQRGFEDWARKVGWRK